MSGAARIEVLDSCDWAIHGGACWNPNGGIYGQLTKVKYLGCVFYVRENLQQAKPSFFQSANERLGMKQGRVPKGAREVLEIACDKSVRTALKTAVEKLEQGPAGRKRKVRAHLRFTVAWAEAQFVERDRTP